MTNWWADAKNTKLAVILGGNPAENHPGVMQWLNYAVDNGGDVLVIDPRKTRTAVWAEGRGGTHVAVRPGTDGALTMGLINYAIANGKVDWQFLYNWTDAAFKLNGSPTGATACGYLRQDAATGYSAPATARPVMNGNVVFGATGSETYTGASGTPWIHDNATASAYCNAADTVFTHLKTRASHYTAARVADICGMTTTQFNTIATKWTDHMGSAAPAAIFYAMGGTHHSTAGQQLHSKCMLQLILGNIGKMGSGVNALRGIHNVQGSTDMGVLADSLPGYSDVPAFTDASYSLHTANGYFGSLFGSRQADGFGGLQQAGNKNMFYQWFRQANAASGASATPTSASAENFALVPRTGGMKHVAMFQAMRQGVTTALYTLGQNPAVTEPNLTEIRDGIKQLDLHVVQDVYYTETAAAPCDGRTWLLPSCAHPEEAGSVTSSARMLAWRYKATACKGGKQDLEILLRLAKALADDGSFDWIPFNSGVEHTGFANRYDLLYGHASQYNWTPGVSPSFDSYCDGTYPGATSASAHVWGAQKFVGEYVAENVYKQYTGAIANTPGTYAPMTSIRPGDFGTVWIYQQAYDKAQSGAEYRYGTRLNGAISSTATTFNLANVIDSGKHTAEVGSYVILGQYGMHGAKEAFWPEGGVQTAGYDSTTALSRGGSQEIVKITARTGSSVTVDRAQLGTTAVEHADGEPFTPWGYWSWHAADGIIAKSRATFDPAGKSLFPRFGWAWLFNRRIFYNMNPCVNAANSFTRTQPGSVLHGATPRVGTRYSRDFVTYCATGCPNRPAASYPTGFAAAGNGTCNAPGDASDYYVKADAKATLFVPHKTVDVLQTPIAEYAGTAGSFGWPTPQSYRKYNTLAETDTPAVDANWTPVSDTYSTNASRFPKHWEPWETPRADLKARYGRAGERPTLMGGSGATSPTALGGTIQAGDAALGDPATYPLVLTTARICWHFQGGPLSRNNPWLCELDNAPYVILNSFDAGAIGLKDGENVVVTTKRGNVTMKARVGVGPQSTQNVKQGVVWMPWHWGNAGLSTGASANEVTIDALDSNAGIPESKACLCSISKP
jgi:anaerobic selenocysteine-containing dehydrogenase